MHYITLGRTGLRVSQMGLGAGGHSSLGSKQGKSDEESQRVVTRAIDLGINLIDTSQRYRTEGIIGRALKGVDRAKLVLSTKHTVSTDGVLVTKAAFPASIERSFADLATDYIDIFHLHGVLPEEYDYAVNELLPVLWRLRDAGRIRFIGITEAFDRDRGHRMLQRAVRDDHWDVIMVGFNMLNQSARERVLPTAARKNIGVLGMFAVRRALSGAGHLAATMEELKQQSLLDEGLDTEGFIAALQSGAGGPRTVPDIAYRYCRDEPAIDSVLVGTGDLTHLESNVETFAAPPLPTDKRRLIAETFGHIDSISGS